MFEPFSTLTESGFSQQADAGWTPELIASLDWLRLAELVRAIADHSECELAGSQVLADGTLAFGMIQEPRTAHPKRALVKLVGWNEWGATAETVNHFAQEVRTARDTRGVLIAPAGFSPSAQRAAQQQRIEMVDAASLRAVLLTLPQERSDFFFTIATAGDCTRPTCPICLTKLEQVESASADTAPSIRVFREKGLIAEHVCCELLDILPGAEVTFLYEVKARSMRVAGRAEGDFLCQGTVTIQPGGTLDGCVAARSMQVEDGGTLLGRFRILEGPPEPFNTSAPRLQWRCRSDKQRPGCEQVCFDPHASS